MLSEEGLVAALRAGVAVSPVPVTVEAEGAGRPAPLLEAALYFCCMEAVQNAAKHAGASRVTVRLHDDGGRWRLDGDGRRVGLRPGARAGRGRPAAGLMNMRDRLDAVGGTRGGRVRAGVGTTVTAVVPDAEAADPPPRDLSLAHQEG